MLVLLGLGIAAAVVRDPALLSDLTGARPHFQLPEIGLGRFDLDEMLIGIFVLGLPQVALTLGNAVIATVEENNALFPDRPLTVRTVAVDHGIMNLVGTSLGGVPMCHGAGGLAGHVRFGARTGGALVMHGAFILLLGLFFGDSIGVMFRLVPTAILGVILLFGGLELASGVKGGNEERADRFVLVLTAGLALWNMGVAYLAGLALAVCIEQKRLRL
jgi:MFS superfamily sulfate permease-like transporter